MICFPESILHLPYRLDVKKWQMRNKKDKNLFQAKKNANTTTHIVSDRVISRLS